MLYSHNGIWTLREIYCLFKICSIHTNIKETVKAPHGMMALPEGYYM